MPVFIIAEIGINHNGDMKLCSDLKVDPKYLTAAWALNDPAARVIYFGIPQVAS